MATHMLLLYAEDADEATQAGRRAELPEWEALTAELRERAIWIATRRCTRSSRRPRCGSGTAPRRSPTGPAEVGGRVPDGPRHVRGLRAGPGRRRRPVRGRPDGDAEVRLLLETLRSTAWANTTIVPTDAVEAVRDLPGTRLMYGFGRLAQSLLAAGLVDELHVGVHPVTVAPARTPLRLLAADRMADGAVDRRYAPT